MYKAQKNKTEKKIYKNKSINKTEINWIKWRHIWWTNLKENGEAMYGNQLPLTHFAKVINSFTQSGIGRWWDEYKNDVTFGRPITKFK